MAEKAQIVVSAEDRTAAAFASVRQSLGKLDAVAAAGQRSLLGLVAGATAAAYGFQKLIDGVAGLKDLEEISGIPGEILGSFGTAAGAAGVALESISDAAVKLSKNLLGVDDDAKAAGAALKYLGIPIEDFKKLNPGEQIEAVSKALAGVTDASSRSNVAIALFGKAGASLLPFLKELQASGGRQVILSQQQIDLADDYADRQAKAMSALRQYAQVAAVQALPAVDALLTATKKFVGELIGVDDVSKTLSADSAVAEFARDAAIGLAVVVESAIGAAKAVRAVGGSFQAVAADVKLLGTVAQFTGPASVVNGGLLVEKNRQEIATALEERNKVVAEANQRYVDLWNYNGTQISDAVRKALSPEEREIARLNSILQRDPTELARRRRPVQKPFGGANDDKPPVAKTSEAERYLETLQKQSEATLNLTTYEKALLDIQKGRVSGLTPALQKSILEKAKEIDLDRQKLELQNSVIAGETARGRAQLDGLDALTKANDQLRREIDLFGLDELGLLGVERARISSTRALKEEELARKESEGFHETQLQALQQEIDLLREREDLLGRRIEKGIEQKSVDEVKRTGDKASSALADSIEQGLLEGFRRGEDLNTIFINELKAQFAKTILKPIISPVAEAGNKLIQQLVGIAATALFGNGAPPDSQTGAQIHGRRAAGGPVAAGSTYLIGERGPELFRPNTSGYVVPNEAIGGRREGNVIVQNYGARVETRRESNGDLRVIVDAAAAEVDRRISRGGSTAQALRGRGVNVTSALARRG